jgi:serine/threonine protein kinase
MAEGDSLRELADAIADGTPIDWQHAKEGVASDDQELVDNYEVVDNVARFFRGAAEENGHEGEPPSSDSDGTREPPFTWGRLQVWQRLKQGAFGEVFRAYDPVLSREVALKLLPAMPGSTDEVIREGQFLAKVRHPNVMAVYGADRSHGRVGIWGELINGCTLAELMEHHGALSVPEASVIGAAVCDALTAVHRLGLLHRDIKAQNVMREVGGRIVLLDFGLGSETSVAPAPRGLDLAGTPLYIAPELFRGQPATAQSDVYGVGVLLFNLVTGRFPVDGSSFQEISENHAAGRRTRLQDLRSNLPSTFVHIVDGALAPDCADRFRSAGALQAALAATLLPAVPRAEPPKPRSRALTPVMTIALLTAIGALLAVVSHRPKPPEPIALTLPPPSGTAFVEGSRNVPAVSPDGKNIAFLANDARSDQLWVRALADPEPRAIPNTSGAIRPFWSPDGRWIAYFVNQGDQRGLWRVNTSGAQPEFLAPGTESRGGSWNREDTLLLALDPERGLQVMSARANAPLRFVTQVDTGAKEVQHMWPQFLPDGRRFIFFVLSGDDNVAGRSCW